MKEEANRNEVPRTLSIEFLQGISACPEGLEWFEDQEERNTEKVLAQLINEGHADWANWLLVRLMTHEQNVALAVFAGRQVLSIYEEKYKCNKAPREAIEAAEAWIKNPCEKTRQAASNAAACAVDAVFRTTNGPTAYAARVAACVARAAARAAADAAYAAGGAVRTATYAAGGARKEMQIKIFQEGIKILGLEK